MSPVTDLATAYPEHVLDAFPYVDGPDCSSRSIKVAIRAALDAGERLRTKQQQDDIQVLREKALRDELIDADLEAETIILNQLHSSFPDYAILSEETSPDDPHQDYQWVVDPLDGSFNFLHGSPTFGIAISLRAHEQPVIGIIYLPFYKELFTAVSGQGAHLNGQSIHASKTADLNRAIVHVGDFAKDGNYRENKEQLKDLTKLANNVGRVRMIGTAATDLAYVACGRADALVVRNASPWDIQAGALLIREAGGVVSHQRDAVGEKLVLCSNKQLHDGLIKVLQVKSA